MNAAESDPSQLGTAKVDVAALALSLKPSTAVVGQEVTVTGTGFSFPGTVDKIEVGEVTVCDSNDNNIANCTADVASGGRVVTALRVPNDSELAEAGEYSVTITDSGGRMGTGMLTIPEPILTVDPEESRIGTDINLSGTGWPTGTGANLVGIYYDDIQYGTATSASDGTWSTSISVPVAAGVGTTHSVEVKATVGTEEEDDDDNVTKKASHKTPAGMLTLSATQAQRGSTTMVSGANFHPFQTVMIEIGGSDVTPAPAPTTDASGSFSAKVLVPGLTLGNQTVKVTVNRVPGGRVPGDRRHPGRAGVRRSRGRVR